MRKLALLTAFTLGACASSGPPVDLPLAKDCQSDGLARFVGQPASQELGAEIQRVSGARTLQWVGHGMMVTMDFSPQRLRVYLTADNRVDRASCG